MSLVGGTTLLVDLGNSALKWGWGAGMAGRLAYGGGALEGRLDQAWGALACPRAVWLASVAAPEHAAAVARWCEGHWGLTPVSVESRAAAAGVVSAYGRPEQLGVDRWLALIAAHARYPQGACILDCGTAATLDLLAPGGRHLGGYILPGLGLMRRALVEHTRIPPLADAAGPGPLGRETATAVGLGGRHALAGLVEHTLAGLDWAPAVVLTGNEAPEVAACLNLPYDLAPDLILEGLARLAEEETT